MLIVYKHIRVTYALEQVSKLSLLFLISSFGLNIDFIHWQTLMFREKLVLLHCLTSNQHYQ